MVGVDNTTSGSGMQSQANKQQQQQQQQQKMDITVSDKFPAGLRVLAVDDDPTCLKILARMLKSCSYEVTVCTRATEALSMLREKKDCFDLVISDVYMPDMDGFKLLEYVGLEMDLPVIMTSSNGETSVVMKGVTHGACDYLIKPVRTEELRNIWQHVVRKKRNEARDVEASGSVEDLQQQQQQQLQQQNQHRRGSGDDGDYTSSVNDGADGNWKLSKRRKDEDENEHDNDDPSTLKKQRVVWSVELHQQFVNAVNQLGIDKAVPKKILELMNVQGLTRENVASHLQKYRLYLRRLSGVQTSAASPSGFSDSAPFGHLNGIGDIRALAATGQISQNTLASLQTNLIAAANRPPPAPPSSMVDPSMLMQQLSGGAQAGFFGGSSSNSARPPAPLLSIPAPRGLAEMEQQISPRTPVDEISGLVLQPPQQQYVPNSPVIRSNGLILPQSSNLVEVGLGGLRGSNGATSSIGLGGGGGTGPQVSYNSALDQSNNNPIHNTNSIHHNPMDSASPGAGFDHPGFRDLYTSNGGKAEIQTCSASSRGFGNKMANLSLQHHHHPYHQHHHHPQNQNHDNHLQVPGGFGGIHQHQHHHLHHQALPARFAIDSRSSSSSSYVGSANFGLEQPAVESNLASSPSVKLESSGGGGTNQGDDLFSIFLKQVS